MNSLYNKIQRLCFLRRGESVSAMCDKIGISRTTMSNLKNGKTKKLSGTVILQIAKYLDVNPVELTMDSLFTRDEPENVPTFMDARLAAYMYLLGKKEELLPLLDVAGNMSKEEIEELTSFIKALTRRKSDDNNSESE